MAETDDTGVQVGPQPAALQEGILFIDLREGMCKFPLGGRETLPTRFCGAVTLTGSVCCLKHQKIAYNKAIYRPR
jgi:GcrA cell cycle regulator